MQKKYKKNKGAQKIYTKNIGAPKLGGYKNIGAFKIFGGCQNLGASKIFGRCQNLGAWKKLGARQCWCSRKSGRTRWRIAFLFRLGRICNCWLLSGPADGSHARPCWCDESRTCRLQVRNGSPMPCFYGRTLCHTVPAAAPARHTQKWSNLWRMPNLWRPPKISLILVKP